MDKIITLTNGEKITIDSTLQKLLIMLHDQISLKRKMVYSTQQLADEMKHVVAQLDEKERTNLLVQSLIVNFKFFEKEMIKEAYEENKNTYSDN
ncbi:hypothetical protein JXQ70_15565 [bacterium]|nr:hypothetical protein [bacterium]